MNDWGTFWTATASTIAGLALLFVGFRWAIALCIRPVEELVLSHQKAITGLEKTMAELTTAKVKQEVTLENIENHFVDLKEDIKGLSKSYRAIELTMAKLEQA